MRPILPHDSDKIQCLVGPRAAALAEMLSRQKSNGGSMGWAAQMRPSCLNETAEMSSSVYLMGPSLGSTGRPSLLTLVTLPRSIPWTQTNWACMDGTTLVKAIGQPRH
jgi:hypothetical protein